MQIFYKVIFIIGFCEFILACGVNDVTQCVRFGPSYELNIKTDNNMITKIKPHQCVKKDGCNVNEGVIKKHCNNKKYLHSVNNELSPAKANLKVTVNGNEVIKYYEYDVGQTIEFLCSYYYDTSSTDIYLMWKVFSQNSTKKEEALIRGMNVNARRKKEYNLKLTMQDFDNFTAVQCYAYNLNNNLLANSGFINFKLRSNTLAHKPNTIGWTLSKALKVENETCTTEKTKVLEIKDNDAFYRANMETNLSICAVYFHSSTTILERKLFYSNPEDEYLVGELVGSRKNNYIYIGCGVLAVALVIVSFCLWRRFKRRDDTEIYSTPQIQYADLDLTRNTSRVLVRKEESPYAEIIGVMEPQTK